MSGKSISPAGKTDSAGLPAVAVVEPGTPFVATKAERGLFAGSWFATGLVELAKAGTGRWNRLKGGWLGNAGVADCARVMFVLALVAAGMVAPAVAGSGFELVPAAATASRTLCRRIS